MVQCDKGRDAIAAKPIGEIVRSVLSVAKNAHRVTLGFSDAIKLLSKAPDEAQFCFLAEPKRGDSATHMHEVLLQAFCYEHGIYIIKVDSGRKLAHVLNTLNDDETCVLIRKSQINCLENGDETNGDNGTMSVSPTARVATTTTTTTARATAAAMATTAAQQDAAPNSATYSSEEDILVNFCENSWHNSDYCIVKLPES